MKPYSTNKDIRTFTQEVEDFELVWHRDREDRYIQPLHKTDWKFQLDNEIPKDLAEDRLFIPKGVYHRLIKGSGDLKIRVEKIN